jgi:outer membrane protein
MFALASLRADLKIGVVNFYNCVENSKLGKQEEAAFDNLRKQMNSLIEDTGKEVEELSKKLKDQEFIDSLSGDAEAEMKNKFDSLNETLRAYQEQFYQVINQAQLRLGQKIAHAIANAAKEVAEKKGLSLILSQESFFFASPEIDYTKDIIEIMDNQFDSNPPKKVDNKASQ